jgi:hypothetical protein
MKAEPADFQSLKPVAHSSNCERRTSTAPNLGSGSTGLTGMAFRSPMIGCPAHVGVKADALGIPCRSRVSLPRLCHRARQSEQKSERPLAGRGGVLLVRTRTNHCA